MLDHDKKPTFTTEQWEKFANYEGEVTIGEDLVKREAKRIRDREYARKKYHENPEKAREAQRRYRANNLEKERVRLREASRRRLAKDPEGVRKQHRERLAKWREAHPVEAKASRQRFRDRKKALLALVPAERKQPGTPASILAASAKYFREHKEEQLAKVKAWQAAHPGLVRTYRKLAWEKRKARLAEAKRILAAEEAEAKRILAAEEAKAAKKRAAEEAKAAKKRAAEEAKAAKLAKIVDLAKAWQVEQARKAREARIRAEAAKPENWHRAIRL